MVSGADEPEAARRPPRVGEDTWYENVADLDRYLDSYNLERSHQRCRLQGPTPVQAPREALGLAELPPLIDQETPMKGATRTRLTAAPRADCRLAIEPEQGGSFA